MAYTIRNYCTADLPNGVYQAFRKIIHNQKAIFQHDIAKQKAKLPELKKPAVKPKLKNTILVRLKSKNNTKGISLGQKLCDYLNSAGVSEKIKNSKNTEKQEKLKESVYDFMAKEKYIRNGIIHTDSIHINIDKAYTLVIKENIWLLVPK